MRERGERIRALLPPLLGVALLGIAVAILRHELAVHHLRDVIGQLRAIPRRDLALALVLTVFGYFCLTGYDWLSFRIIRHSLPYRLVACASFVGYVFTHNFGLSFFSGSAVRYRMLASWGVAPGDVARVLTYNVLAFWLGFLALGGLALALDPVALADAPWLTASSRPLGAGLLAALLSYATWSGLRREPVRLHGFEISVPRPPVTAAQILVSSVDWLLAASVLWVVLPEAPGLSFLRLVGIFLLGQFAGLVSNVPAGLGVFEGTLVLLLRDFLPADQVLASILAYRIVYYLVPLAAAVAVFAAFEALQQRAAAQAALGAARAWLPSVVPRVLAVTTFAGGALLLLSGSTPAAPGRMALLDRLLPLSAIELSHFLGSAIGAALLVLAWAVQQRVEAAYFASLALLGAGALASLLKSFDWEGALALSAMAAALLPCRDFFHRRSSLLTRPFSGEWLVAIAVAIAGALFVTEFASAHVSYTHDLWWRFELDAHVPRSLRALVGASLVLALSACVWLLRPSPPARQRPTASDLDRAQAIVREAPRAAAHLVLLGDKQILFHDSEPGFVMYGVEGGTWVAMGDPVGRPEARRELAWRFRELADRSGGGAAFYEVSAEDLPVYVDLGLSLYKLGEEARVSLTDFSLAGGARKDLRQAHHRAEREGCHFEIVPVENVGPLLDEVEAVSAAWLREKSTREKGFSLGFFDRAYLARLPLALVRRQDRILAFANVWEGARSEELSVDLMRYGPEAPHGVMDFLFSELMHWGSARGFRWFSLGVAPLSGFERHRLAPLWSRLGAFLFRHGEHFYNFQGLRAFKEKFEPVWEPRYLASPRGWRVGIVLARVASLISGGVAGVVSK